MKRLLLALLVMLMFAAPATAVDHWDLVSGGQYFTHAIKNDGTLWGWGFGEWCQLGDNTSATKANPVRIGTGTTWASISHGFNFSLGIKTDGTLWFWGVNNEGQAGNGAVGGEVCTPTQVGSASNWASASGGWNHVIAVRTDGTLWGWGWNYYGEVGDGTNTRRTTPVQIGSDTNWSAVAAGGWHSLALKSTGAMYGWGRNYAESEGTHAGMVGDGTSIDRNAPVQIGAGTTWSAIAAGFVGSGAIASDGTLWTWGGGHRGELGLGDYTNRLSPTQVGVATTWATLTIANDNGHAVRTDGTLWGWGENEYGQVGDGTTTDRLTPVQIATGWTSGAPARSYYHSLGLKTDGTLWAWGRNDYGQVGDGSLTDRTSPLEILAPTGTTYRVNASGCGGADFCYTTIADCATAAQAGDTCLVYPGTYAERITTVRDGTSTDRITFRAYGTVAVRGITINHAYATFEGFTVTHSASTGSGWVQIGTGGDNCLVTNNHISGRVTNVYGVYFDGTASTGATDCTFTGNTIRDTIQIQVSTRGSGHLFQYNVFERTNQQDYAYFFGSDITFRRNLFRDGNAGVGGGHQDLIQVFGDNYSGTGGSEDVVFEENFFVDNEGAFSQVTSSHIANGVLYDDIRGLVLRRNVFANIAGNGSILIPDTVITNNTFYRLAYSGTGLAYTGSSLTRGDSSNATLTYNVFLANSNAPNDWERVGYSFTTIGAIARMNREVIGVHITSDPSALGDNPGNATTQGIAADLVANGYLSNTDGWITNAARALTSIDDFVFSETYAAYKTATYNHLIETVALDTAGFASTVDYNYSAGAPPGYTARKTTGCTPGVNFAAWNFCEPNGVNGGDPKFTNYASPLGADSLPWTLDDGFKPAADSPLCSAAIGAYSCTSNVVIQGGAALPAAATSLAVVATEQPLLQWTHAGGATEFFLMIDREYTVAVPAQTPVGSVYATRLPNLTAGQHTLIVMACTSGGCTASDALTIVKM